MTSIMAPWPFYQWGMDILGPLTPARGGAKFVVVAIDYFTKWVEGKPKVKITGKEIIRFVMDNIICRYGLPRIIVMDNGAQLVSDPFKSWCKRFEIQQMNTAVAHPQANSLVERANRSLMEGIKTRLGREKAGWVDELPNNEVEAAAIRESKYKSKMEQYYNKKVRPAGFRPGELYIEGMRQVEWRTKGSWTKCKPIQSYRSVRERLLQVANNGGQDSPSNLARDQPTQMLLVGFIVL
ncbi:reverse transcriptase domain-containing protein [Tanacetum coccineum]